MIIDFQLYRAKNNDIFLGEKIGFNIQNDSQLLVLDTLIQDLLMNHIKNIPIIKKYGLGYIGNVELLSIEITNDDNISLNELAFKNYASTLTRAPIIWSRDKNIKYIESELPKDVRINGGLKNDKK